MRSGRVHPGEVYLSEVHLSEVHRNEVHLDLYSQGEWFITTLRDGGDILGWGKHFTNAQSVQLPYPTPLF